MAVSFRIAQFTAIAIVTSGAWPVSSDLGAVAIDRDLRRHGEITVCRVASFPAHRIGHWPVDGRSSTGGNDKGDAHVDVASAAVAAVSSDSVAAASPRLTGWRARRTARAARGNARDAADGHRASQAKHPGRPRRPAQRCAGGADRAGDASEASLQRTDGISRGCGRSPASAAVPTSSLVGSQTFGRCGRSRCHGRGSK